MPKKEVPVNQLEQFLPPGTGEAVLQYLHTYKVHLTIARERKSILGDYRHRTHQQNHRISVNGNLNPYAFLITTLHEIAHLVVFEKYQHRVQAHGKEWQQIFSHLLARFLQRKLFPPDIEAELHRILGSPAASSCAEDGLIRILRRYDTQTNGRKLVEELEDKALFKLEDGRVFQRGAKQRKRYMCVEVKTGRAYLFSPVYEVSPV